MSEEPTYALPQSDSESAPYWEGIQQGELRIQFCTACRRHVFYPRMLCPHCHSDQLIWVTASGRGIIYSYTVVHRAFGPFAAEAPFIIAIVELEEGVRLMTRLINTPRERVRIGAPVQVTFDRVSGRPALPFFRLAE
ncbi:Zn-ribbon domain-containing OB-fold protein [Thermogemmatispora sp.]|uniref:Zn-ribbon domain-containing OB-fold protein n=1 Tax=Thermogemmatispora sp. TaxID=1968838 RepID=UPI001D52CD8A|nr:Zn-ribbon domain-containing OB-fold protein [Thermogemmatispora sp.]MBX5450461.1 Zn-ribbon domain-containing OB-fold protein [Thermogemmatispora sp.]